MGALVTLTLVQNHRQRSSNKDFLRFKYKHRPDLFNWLIKMVKAIGSMAELTQQLEEAGDKLVVIDFHAVWCGPCKMIAPRLEEMSNTKPNVVFLKVDVDEAEDVAAEYNISAMPTFIFMKNKNRVGELMGANADKLKELVEQHA